MFSGSRKTSNVRTPIPWIVAALAIFFSGCGGRNEPAPTSPSGSGSHPPQIRNLRVRELGFNSALCDGSILDAYDLWDEVIFDYTVVNEATLSATQIYYRGLDGVYHSVAGRSFADPVSCRDTDPCRGLRLCRLNTNGSSGTLRAYVSSRWVPTWNWDVRMAVPGPQGLAIDSNALTATVTRPQPPPGLPVGDRAALIQFTASRPSANVGSFLIAVYSPGVSGRRLSISLFMRSRGQSIPGFPDQTVESEERLVNPVAGLHGGTNMPNSAFDAIAEFTEVDGTGAIIATDRQTIAVPGP